MGNDKPEDIEPLPLSIVSLKRAGGEGTVNTTGTAGYAWHFTYDLQQSSRQVLICFLEVFF